MKFNILDEYNYIHDHPEHAEEINEIDHMTVRSINIISKYGLFKDLKIYGEQLNPTRPNEYIFLEVSNNDFYINNYIEGVREIYFLIHLNNHAKYLINISDKLTKREDFIVLISIFYIIYMHFIDYFEMFNITDKQKYNNILDKIDKHARRLNEIIKPV